MPTPHPDPTLPPAHHEYTHAYPVPGHGRHESLFAVDLHGVGTHWRSEFSWSDPAMAQRAGNLFLAQSQSRIGA